MKLTHMVIAAGCFFGAVLAASRGNTSMAVFDMAIALLNVACATGWKQ